MNAIDAIDAMNSIDFLFCFLRALGCSPPFTHFFSTRVKHQCPGRYIMADSGGGGDVDIVMNSEGRHQSRVGTNLYAIADLGAVLAEAIVVASDRASADVSVPSDLGVPDIR